MYDFKASDYYDYIIEYQDISYNLDMDDVVLMNSISSVADSNCKSFGWFDNYAFEINEYFKFANFF